MNYWQILTDSISQVKFSDFINLFTLFVLTWTAQEGYRSRISNNEANELKLLPFIVIYFDTQDFNNMKCHIENLGEGVAFDIQIIPWQFILTDAHEILKLRLRLSGTNVLSKDDKKELEVKAFKNEKVSGAKDFLFYAIAPRSDSDSQEGFSAQLTVLFRNARSVRYVTKIITSPTGINILEPPHRITLMTEIRLFWELKIQPMMYERYYNFVWLFRKPSYKLKKTNQ